MKKYIKRLAITGSVCFLLAYAVLNTAVTTVGTIATVNTSGDSYNGELYGDSTEEQVWFFFLSNGFTKEATAGIMGNMQGESEIDPTSIQYPSQAAAGICQWQYYSKQSGRWLKLKKYAEKKGKEWTDLQSQLEFLLAEMQGEDSTTVSKLKEYCGGYEEFKALTDVDKAAEIFLNSFERPRNRDATLRQKYAREIYEKYKDLSMLDLNAGSGSLGTGTAEVSATGVPRYYQNDYADVAYGSSNLKDNGCGPTSFAMAASYITGTQITPKDAVQWCGNRYWVSGHGTSWSYFAAAAKHFGLGVTVKETAVGSQTAVMNALKNGKMVIASQAPGLFTRHGHFILLVGVTSDGKILVNDPNKANAVGKGYNDRKFTWSEINANAKKYWIFQ